MCGCWPLLHFYLADPGRSLEQGKTHAPRLAIFFWLPEMDRNSSGSGLGVFTGTSEARVTRSTDLDQPYRGRMVQLLATEAPNSMCQMTTQRGALRPLHPRWHCRISIDIRCRFFYLEWICLSQSCRAGCRGCLALITRSPSFKTAREMWHGYRMIWGTSCDASVE